MSGAMVPQLRFPGFAGEWEAKTLGDFMVFKNGVNAEKDQYGSGTKFINVLDIIAAGPIYHDKIIGRVEVSERDLEKNDVRYGDVLFQRSSETREEVGQSNIYLDEEKVATFGGFVIRGRPIQDFDPRFFDGLLRTDVVRSDMTSRSGGSTRFNIGQDALSMVAVTVPREISEQQKIADFLGTVDAKLDALRRKKSGLEAFKSGLMQRLFSRELRFTRDDGTEFPEWEEKTFGELVDWQSTNSLSREFLTDDPGDFQNIHYGDIHGKFPALFRQSVAAAPYITSTAPIRAPKDADFCRPGDVIFADASEDYADIGKTIEIIEVEEHSLLAGLHTHLARPKDGCFAIGFPGYLMRTEAVRHQVMQFAQGISVLGISKDNLAKVRVQVPHPDEQRKIADALSAMDAKIAADANQITHMESFKKGLLQQMFV